MLKCYFDDGGTHDGSPVMVWGGILGHSAFLEEFENNWNAQLREPCEGKPPIKAFHSAHLKAGIYEFLGYNRAESDRTRYLFRKVITDAGLSVASFGISVSAWKQLVPERLRPALGDHERALFGMVIKSCCEMASREEIQCSLEFDLGRKNPNLDSIIQSALEAANATASPPSIRFSPVSGNCALQAADLVAHETYQFFNEYNRNADVEPDVHLLKLFEGVHDAQAGWIGPEEISEFLEELELTLTDPSRADL